VATVNVKLIFIMAKKMGAANAVPYLRYRQAPAKGTQTEDAPKRARFRQHHSFG
jgi:hypothetical protein